MTKLITVADTFDIQGRGLILSPVIPLSGYSGPVLRAVRLLRPDGSEISAAATLEIPFVRPSPPEPCYLCVLAGLSKDQVPLGTEVCVLREPAA